MYNNFMCVQYIQVLKSYSHYYTEFYIRNQQHWCIQFISILNFKPKQVNLTDEELALSMISDAVKYMFTRL